MLYKQLIQTSFVLLLLPFSTVLASPLYKDTDNGRAATEVWYTPKNSSVAKGSFCIPLEETSWIRSSTYYTSCYRIIADIIYSSRWHLLLFVTRWHELFLFTSWQLLLLLMIWHHMFLFTSCYSSVLGSLRSPILAARGFWLVWGSGRCRKECTVHCRIVYRVYIC